MERGERWAHRVAPYKGPVNEVEVLKVGTQRPVRVKVRFVADEAEGREEWVPKARLRVPWEEKDAWLHRQDRWDALISDGPEDDQDTDFVAASLVFDTCPVTETVSMGWNTRERGVLYIHDVPALASMLQVPQDLFTSDPRTFTDDDGTLNAPWPTTLAVAERIAAAHAAPLLAVLAEQEKQAQHDALYGRYYRGRGKGGGTHISPEICDEVDQKYQPGRDLARQWCGTDATARLDELQALRAEVIRIGKLTEEAITALHTAGENRKADDLTRRLGVPLESLRNAADHRH
ncbi:hypothetical protein ACGFX4_40215 [Kitasatospora sp. NPDC048365]|uniref:hypothetical protein n=1 Tax=Kitasatospora sp. NPDC048365 TaxID=3364050 RepID=UPI003718FD5D